MNFQKNIPYYIVGVFVYMLLKLGFKYANHKDLSFLIKPTDNLISILTGSSSIYIEGNGYYNRHLHILIDKSCAGFNFWILCFLMILFLCIKYAKTNVQKIVSIPLSLFFAFLLTLTVNTSRIFVSVTFQDRLSSVLNLKTTIIHEGIGIFINLSFLILIYLISEKLISKHINYAKLT